jgi:subfamily B ATP-binding cassette protein MsbA
MQDLKRLLRYVRPYLPLFVIALVAMVFVAVFETAIGAMLVPITEQFIGCTDVKARAPFDLNALVPKDDWYRAWMVIGGLLIAFTILKGIAEYLSTFLMAKIGQSVVLNIRRELYEHILRQSAAFFERHRSNYLVSRLVVSCAAIEQAVTSNLRDVLRESIMLVFFLGAALYLNWRLTLGALIIGPIIAYITSEVSRRMRKLAEVSLKGNKDLNETAHETFANHVIVKSYSGEKRSVAKFVEAAGTIARANLRGARYAALSPPVIEIVGIIAVVVLLYFGLSEVNAKQLAPARYFAFLYFLLRSYDPMRKISRQHNELSRALAAARDIWSVLDEHDELPEKADAVTLGPLKDRIKIENVSFKYSDERKYILRDINLEVPRGSTVALVGESGGGKSSLTKLIQRLYDPTEGRITWDGIDLRDAKILDVRRNIAIVSQETVLFNDTIFNNITFGRPDATLDEVRDAAKVAFADEFISQFPDGYDTMVGERGMLLSGGQRQRIAIARAVIADAPVLILDEATSALDSESESIVQQAMANLMQNRTSIVIAHRLSTVRNADLIVVMQAGEIIETGTHEELLEQSGVYQRLYSMQFALDAKKEENGE